MASRFKRSVPVTVNDVLEGHAALDLECLDRLYLHGYLGQLQVSGQVIQFLTHRGYKIYSAACLQQIGDGFRRRVASFAEANDIPVVALKAADRNIEVMRPYLDKAAASGRSQVAAIGVAQEVQRVFLARQRDTDPSKPPQFSFGKKDRRVTVYYFYLWDAGFGDAFIKVCTYCPWPMKIWVNGQYAEQPAMPHEAEARPVTVGSRMLETAYLCRLRRHDLVACPSLWVSVSHIDGTGEIMTSEVRRIGGLRPPAEVTGPLAEHAAAFKQMLI